MKNYKAPQIEITTLEISDVILSSLGDADNTTEDIYGDDDVLGN